MRSRYRTHLQLNACASHSTQRKSLHHEFHSLSPTTCMVRKAKQLLLAGGWHWLAGPGCPLRVMSGHTDKSPPCPFFPSKQTFVNASGTSAMCHKRT